MYSDSTGYIAKRLMKDILPSKNHVLFESYRAYIAKHVRHTKKPKKQAFLYNPLQLYCYNKLLKKITPSK